MSLRDPRAFRVLSGSIFVVSSDEQLERIYRGDRLGGTMLTDRYNEGDVVPAGQMPRTSVSVLIGRGRIEPVAEPPTATPAAAALADAKGVDLASVPGERVTVGDVRAYLAAREDAQPEETEEQPA